ncbi:MAG: TIGR00266 family protein [Pseudonocardiaceae bacterium]|nr:TIGR00266 family protein [Pseudonocardiaceae bacterium]
MQVHTRHGPAFGVVRLLLSPGEAVRVDNGSMMASSYGVAVETSGKRANGSAVLTAPNTGGWVDVASHVPGDVYPIELDGNTGWCLARDSVLALTKGVRFDPQWQGFHSLFGAEAGFLEHWSGRGSMVLACSGAADLLSLEQGELITVSPGYLLAYPDGVQCRLRAIDQSAPQSLRTGEGLAVDFAGPAQVLLRTRAP